MATAVMEKSKTPDELSPHERAEYFKARLDRLLDAARPFAEHDWMDASEMDDGCKLATHSGPIKVGH